MSGLKNIFQAHLCVAFLKLVLYKPNLYLNLDFANVRRSIIIYYFL